MANTVTTIRNSLSAGELSPSMAGRTDVEKVLSGAFTARNFFANYKGGMSSRAGLAYVGMCKQQFPTPPRDIPFQFSLTQGYALEFGDNYMRVKYQGAYILEGSFPVSVASNALFTTSTPHGYSAGDWVFFPAGDYPEFAGRAWIITATPTSSTFFVSDLFSQPVVTATPGTGGIVQRILTVTAPYLARDLPYLKYSQSADVMTLTCVNTSSGVEYPPYSLTRTSNTNWTFTVNTFTSTISAPTGLTATARSSDVPSTWYAYVVTAVSADTGEESVQSNVASVQNNDIALSAGSNSLTWNDTSGASYYNVYAAPASYTVGVPISTMFGLIGVALGPAFTDTNIQPDFTKVPPVHGNPFAVGAITDTVITAGGSNYDQTTVGYTITTSTGTGFSGTPLVANGSVVGMITYNQGQGYQPGDTIHFTDSGGGIATGNYSVASNAVDGDTITINGFTFTFRNSNHANSFGEIHRGASIEDTIQSLAIYMNSSKEIPFVNAYYTYDATHLYITYKTPGARGNTFTLGGGPAGWTASGGTLSGGGTAGSGATATLSIGPQSGNYPSVTNYFSQRRIYGNSLNKPDTYWMSQPGLFQNMDSSIPVKDDDAITGTPWAQQVNGIQWFVPMPGGCVVFTGKSAWQLNGGQQAAITPSNQNAVAQAVNGCSSLVQPIVINEHILFVQSKGFMVRDLAYNFFINIYTGTDLTIFSSHLFTNHQIVRMGWAEEPYKIIWTVLDNGQMLSLTYLREQEMFSWTRHDTDGLFKDVCIVTEPPVDAVYVITQRLVKGSWYFYSERMDNRLWEDVEDCFCVDAGLTTEFDHPNAILYPADITGNTHCSASDTVFSAGDIGRIIRVGGGKLQVTSLINAAAVNVTVLEDITAVVPDNPDLPQHPLPALPGEWSIATPFTNLSGLNHLEGKTVSILADGSVYPQQVVTNGSLPTPFPYPVSVATVGLPYTCQVQTTYMEHPEGGNTSQNRRKNISAVGLRLDASRGMTIGADQPDQSFQPDGINVPWTDMLEIKERGTSMTAGTAIPLFTGDYYKNITSTWSVKGQIAVEQDLPLPCNVLAFIAYWQTGDDK